ncbi:MAG: CHC2 zinc finger domain-containing protein, partial [Planctomycetota bacterium]
MDSGDREKVLAATDIVDLVAEHVQLKPKGREYLGLCPFHDDRTPSMYVVPHKQMFHCFACGAGGNAFDFTMQYHSIEFREALELLARRANVELTPLTERKRTPRQRHGEARDVSRAELARACEYARGFYRAILR